MCDTLEKIEIIHTTVINADIFGSWTVRSREPILPWQASNNYIPLRDMRCYVGGSILGYRETFPPSFNIPQRDAIVYTRPCQLLKQSDSEVSLQMASLACQDISACPP